jgi:hypothetical protein
MDSTCSTWLNMPPPEPTMFGRELTEQVRADSKHSERMVPLIVEKCIAAVEASGEPFYWNGQQRTH